jgi:hypothetical protein
MFFSLTTDTKSNFAKHFALGKINLYTDAGWHQQRIGHHTVVYKGYADGFDLKNNLDQVIDQLTPEFNGNFCVICHDHGSGEVCIKSDRWRSFPIFLHRTEVTNLIKSDVTAWSDSVISVSQDFDIDEKKFDVIGKIETSVLSREQALDSISQILDHKTNQFLSHNCLPIRVHLSGGVDSLLVYSLLKKHGGRHELITASHFDYDKFWLLNDSQIKSQFWAYNQLHHWNDPCVLTSGAPGDEFMLRSPTTIDMLLKYRGTSVLELLEKNKNSLHIPYFNRDKHIKLFREQVVDQQLPISEFYWNLCNIVVNDWQHWHLGNTLTWTPLRDLEIFKILLRLETHAAVEQMFDSSMSIQLIEHNVPGMGRLISDKKNSHNPMKNLVDFYSMT